MSNEREAQNRIDNRGISLVELIVVITIMAVMTGITALGVGIMFTKDASYVAVRIDDELTEARMLSMSRSGAFTYVLHYDNGDPASGYIQILEGDATRANNTEFKKVAFDKSVKITVTGEGVSSTSPASGNISIVFNKAQGNVQEIGSVGPAPTYAYTKIADAKEVYTIKVESTKNSAKTSTVTLISTTGRHYAEK